jgi:hypothetical protein
VVSLFQLPFACLHDPYQVPIETLPPRVSVSSAP